MAFTNCKVHMEFVDVTALPDSSPVFANADIGNLELLKSASDYPDYLIPDLNNAVLDGSRVTLEENTRIPLISDISGDDGTFATPPVLTVSFTSPHTSAGITLFFLDDYPANIKVAWYGTSGQKIIEEEYAPDDLTFLCKKQVENYGKIVITFLKTRLPQRRIQLAYIKYGMEMEWDREKVKSASVTHEVDGTYASLPIGTAEVSIVDENNDFDLTNRDGMWTSIQKNQTLIVTEELATKEVACGQYYIDTWSSSANIVSFSMLDVIGLMDKTKFYEGRIYENEKAGIIIGEIMTSAGISAYTVAEDVQNIEISGYLGVCSHREALQSVLFICGAICDCMAGVIAIYKPGREVVGAINIARKFSTEVKMAEYVSGVSVTFSRYAEKTEAEEIYAGVLPAGNSTIEFSAPYKPSSIEVTAGTIVKAATNYVVIHIDEESECTVSGIGYEVMQNTFTLKRKNLAAGETENIKSCSGCTLISYNSVKGIAERLLNYYELNQQVTIKYLIDAEKNGDWVNCVMPNNGEIVCGIYQQSIDLTGGFIATATCRGYSTITTVYEYSGEFYTGERGLI